MTSAETFGNHFWSGASRKRGGSIPERVIKTCSIFSVGTTAWKKLDKPLVTGPDEKRTLENEIINKRVTQSTV